MDMKDVLAQLREERDRIDTAIAGLEGLGVERPRGPGRPPRLVTKSVMAKSSTNGFNHSYIPPDGASGEPLP